MCSKYKFLLIGNRCNFGAFARRDLGKGQIVDVLNSKKLKYNYLQPPTK